MYYAVEAMVQERSEDGKFAPKSQQPREVRSIRLTDKTWTVLGDIADQRRITRADLLEELVEQEELSRQSIFNRSFMEGLVAQVLDDSEVTRGTRDRGAAKRALEALLKRLFLRCNTRR